MASTTARGALPYPAPGDADDVPGDVQRLADRLAVVVAFYAQGTLGNRPTTNVAGSFYKVDGTSDIYYNDGTGWTTVGTRPSFYRNFLFGGM